MDSGDAPVALARTPPGTWPVVLGLLVIAASLGLQIWFPRLDSSELNDTWNVDFGGRNAIYQVAERRWSQVSRNLIPLSRSAKSLATDGTLCILGPARPPSDAEWKELLDWVGRGGRLLFAPPWKNPEVEIPALRLHTAAFEKPVASRGTPLGQPQPNAGPPPNPVPELIPGQVPPSPPVAAPPAQSAAPASDTTSADPVASDTAAPDAAAAKGGAAGIFSLQGIDWQTQAEVFCRGPNDVLLRTSQGVQGVELQHGRGRIIVLATDHLFSNRSLNDDPTRRAGILAVKLLQRLASSDTALVFDESLNASGQPQVVGLLLNHWLRPVTLQVVTLLLLFGWAGSQRFGSPLPPRQPPRHSLVEHTDALGNLYWRSRNGLVPLQAYLERLLTELRLGRDAERLPRRIDHLAATTGLQPVEIEARIRQAREAVSRRAVRHTDAARLIRLLSELRPRTPDGHASQQASPGSAPAI